MANVFDRTLRANHTQAKGGLQIYLQASGWMYDTWQPEEHFRRVEDQANTARDESKHEESHAGTGGLDMGLGIEKSGWRLPAHQITNEGNSPGAESWGQRTVASRLTISSERLKCWRDVALRVLGYINWQPR